MYRWIRTTNPSTWNGGARDTQPDLHFRIERGYGGHDTVVIAYTNKRGVHTAKTLTFDADSIVFEASARHAD